MGAEVEGGGGGELPGLRTDGGMEVRRVVERLEAALVTETGDGLDLSAWLAAYAELNLLFGQLGGRWSFIQRDIGAKVERLGRLPPLNASALLTPARAERADPDTRAFLVLIRAQDFITRVVWDVFEAGADSPLGPVARTAYDETLGRYHGWAVRQLVHAAMLGLGRRRDLAPYMLGPLTEAQARPFFLRLRAAATALSARVRPFLQACPALQRLHNA